MENKCFWKNIFQALTEVATMVARALYIQAGGAETQLSSINADPQTVRLLDLIWESWLKDYWNIVIENEALNTVNSVLYLNWSKVALIFSFFLLFFILYLGFDSAQVIYIFLYSLFLYIWLYVLLHSAAIKRFFAAFLDF